MTEEHGIPTVVKPVDVCTIDCSGLRAYHTCPMIYYYRYICGIVPAVPVSAPSYGKAFHKAWRELYRQQVSKETQDVGKVLGEFLRAFPEDLDELHTRGNGTSILTEYVKHYKEEPFVVIVTEAPFQVNLGAFDFMGRIDAIVRWYDKVLVMEHKTSTRPAAILKEFDYGIQPIGYVYASKLLGYEECEGVLLNVTAVNMPKTAQAMKRWEEERFTRKVVTISEQELHTFHILVNLTMSEIWDGRFYKNLNGCNVYGRCDYYSICKYGWDMVSDSYVVSVWDPYKEDEDNELLGGL